MARSDSRPLASETRPDRPAHGTRLHLRAAVACVLPDGTVIALESKDALLLAFLAIEGPTARELLAERLWPDAQPARARANLRQRLMRLRRHVGIDLIEGATRVSLAEGVVHDLDAGSELLAPVGLDEAGGLADWLGASRQARRSHRIEQLAATAARAESAGEIAAALDLGQTLLGIDSISEHAHRRVMRLHYLRGDVAAARAAYAQCAEVLKRELGVAPAAETEALRRQIESGLPAAGTVRGPLPVTLLRPPSLIGREAPLARLQQAWHDGRTFLLTGEAGMGKSRLLEELVARLPAAVLVAGRPGDRALPLALLARLLRQLSSRLPQLAQRPEHAELTRRLPGGEATEATGSRGIGALFGALLGDTALSGLIIDDLQWADEASLDALREARAFDHETRVRWGFASRLAEDEDGEQRIAHVLHDYAAETVALAPLDVTMLQRLLASLAIAPDDVGNATQRLLAKVGGNPLFVLEVLRQVHAGGGDWGRIFVPPRVADLMDRRLHGLSDGALMLARIAAIAGTDFSAEIAESVAGLDTLALADPWRELEDAQLLRATAFTHDLALAAVQRSIPESIAARLHGRVAVCLQENAADPARIARHYLAAGQEREAAPFLLAAGRQTWRAGCAREGAEFFFQSAEIELALGRPDVAFDVLFDAAYAMAQGGSAQLLQRASALLTQLARTPDQKAKALLGEVAAWELSGGDTEGFLQRVDAALMQAIAAGARSVEAECRVFQGSIAGRQGRLHEAIAHLAAAETLFRETGVLQRAVQLQCELAVGLGFLGDCERALQMLQALPPSANSPVIAASRVHQSSFVLALGRPAQARAHADTAAAMLGKVDMSDKAWPSAVANTAGAFRRIGDYTRALAVLDEERARLGKSPFEPVIDSERAHLLLDLGRPDLAARAFASFERSETASYSFVARVPLLRAAMLIATGKPALSVLATVDPLALEHLRSACDWMLLRGQLPADEQAVRQNEALLARCADLDLEGLRAPLLAVQAKFNAELTSPAEGRRNAEATLPLLDRCIPNLVPLVCAWLSTAFEAAGRPTDAHRCIRIGCEWIERTARESVPAAFRESFLHRNPINRELLRAATRG